jgi:dsDNA-specific endonuclease/ATPase MutS2
MDLINALSPLTLAVILVIALLTVYFHGPVYSLRTVNAAPSILTSIGIFGTFLGVALGLMDFDSKDIEGSVPPLIEGLKTAFWSSIAGLLAAMTIKLRHVIKHVRNYEAETKYTGATVDDLASLLGDIRHVLHKSGLADIGSRMENSTRGIEQHLGRLEQVIGRYQQDMVEANSSALTEAITELMTSFNDKITVQYGENFRQLNEAVGQMLEWQDNYRDELAKLLHQQQANGEVLDKAADAYKTMVQHTQAFNDVSEKLGDVMTGLQQQSESLGSYLDSLANLVSKASDGLPALEGRILTLTEELASGIEISHQQMNQLLTRTANTIETTVITVNQQLIDDMQTVNTNHNDMVVKMLDRNEQQLVRIDSAMEKELTHALQTFGCQLTALSEKFVSDYLPLTEKLKKVVDMAHSLPNTAERKSAK